MDRDSRVASRAFAAGRARTSRARPEPSSERTTEPCPKLSDEFEETRTTTPGAYHLTRHKTSDRARHPRDRTLEEVTTLKLRLGAGRG